MYRNIFSGFEVGFAIFVCIEDDLVDFIILTLNSMLTTIMGLDKSEVIGRKVSQVVPFVQMNPVDWINHLNRVVSGEIQKKISSVLPINREVV
jgi:hypothetical protein